MKRRFSFQKRQDGTEVDSDSVAKQTQDSFERKHSLNLFTFLSRKRLNIYSNNTNFKIGGIKSCKCNPYSPFVRAGPFILGAQLNDTQFSDLDHFIARRIDDPNPNRHYLLKIVVLPKTKYNESHAQRQAKLLLFNEYSVLSLLTDQKGVIHHQGLYMDYFYEKTSKGDIEKCSNEECLNFFESSKAHQEIKEIDNDKESTEKHTNNFNKDVSLKHHYLACKYLNANGRFMRRIILAFECYIPHIFCSTVPSFPNSFNKFPKLNSEYENLQEYVKRFKNIPEMKALQIFDEIVDIIFNLHKKNIAHRDLRLENILYNHRNGKILLVNFGLARYVINDLTCINDHRGSSAYISPDVLKRRPYNPKASDCWALGIIFYTMLFGKFPFYAENFADLFKKINSGLFILPSNVLVWRGTLEQQPSKTESHSIVICTETMNIINSLIVTDSIKRMAISELQQKIKSLIKIKMNTKNEIENKLLVKQGKCLNQDLQTVPDIIPEFQNSCIKNNFPMLSSKTGLDQEFDSWFKIASNSNELIDNKDSLSIESYYTKKFKSSMYDSIENGNKLPLQKNLKAIDIEHLHDHTYSQKDLLSKKSSLIEEYVKSSNLMVSPRKIPSPYFSLQNRFNLKCGTSIYANNSAKLRPLILETNDSDGLVKSFDMPKLLYSDGSNSTFGSVNLNRKSLNSNQNNAGSNKQAAGTDIRRDESACRKDNKFPNYYRKRDGSNFTVLKIDGDIRPLTENEINLFSQYTSYKANF